MRSTIFIIAALLCNSFIQSAILRVSKDLTYLPHYSEVQTAVDGAVAGDTIHVYPGNYGDVVIRKKIAIFGVGYFLVENDKDSLTSFTTPSNMGTITFKPGSDFSIISGTSSGRLNCDTVSNIYISGVNAGGLTLNKCNSMIIQKNYLVGFINAVESRSMIFSNNIIVSEIIIDGNSEMHFLNNYLQNRIIAYNSIIQNNIFMANTYRDVYHRWYDVNGFANCRVEKNIFNKVAFNIDNFSTGNFSDNYFGTTPEIFVPQIKADKYLLNDTSIAKGAGVGGIDCGPYGGDDPYCPSGIIMIPTVVRLSIPTKASAESGLNIKAIIKSNKP